MDRGPDRDEADLSFALALFTLASALCGAAQSLPQLIAARALQGVGGGLLTPTGTAMLYRAYGPERRARVARTLLLPILIGPGRRSSAAS